MARHWILLVVAVLLSGCVAPAAPVPTPQATYPPVASSSSPTPAVTLFPTASPVAPTPVVPPPRVGPEQKWIEVDLAQQVVRLRSGDKILGEYLAATGVATATETTTLPGVYMVQQMIKGPIENVPGVFVSDILIYDFGREVGIHSLPMDKDGQVLDTTLGKPTSGGCVRVGEAAAVFEFAELGTRVWIH